MCPEGLLFRCGAVRCKVPQAHICQLFPERLGILRHQFRKFRSRLAVGTPGKAAASALAFIFLSALELTDESGELFGKA
jgi:hypothetical protein